MRTPEPRFRPGDLVVCVKMRTREEYEANVVGMVEHGWRLDQIAPYEMVNDPKVQKVSSVRLQTTWDGDVFEAILLGVVMHEASRFAPYLP